MQIDDAHQDNMPAADSRVGPIRQRGGATRGPSATRSPPTGPAHAVSTANFVTMPLAFQEVDRRDEARIVVPRFHVQATAASHLLHCLAIDDARVQTEPVPHLLAPQNPQTGRGDEDRADAMAQHRLPGDQAAFDGLAEAKQCWAEALSGSSRLRYGYFEGRMRKHWPAVLPVS